MSEPGGQGRPRSPVITAAILVIGLALVLVAAASVSPWEAGSWSGGEAPTGSWEISGEEPVTPSMPEDAATGQIGEVAETSWPLTLEQVVLIGSILLAILVVAAVVATLLRRRARAPQPGAAGEAAAQTELEEPDPETIREGIADAARIFDGDLEPRDAVVKAWVALERAAAASGVPRRASQTTAEFAQHVLAVRPGDSEPISVLRECYLSARFSTDAAEEKARAASARQALALLADSWTQVTS